MLDNQQAPLPLLWLMCAASAAAYVGYTTLPFLMGVLSESGGLSLADAGTLGSLELAAMAVTALLLAPRVSRLSPKKMALIGAAIAISAHCISAVVTGFEALVPFRILAGIGEGTLIATSGPLLARSSTPEKLSGQATVVAGFIWAVVLSFFPLAVKGGSQFMAFAVMSLIVVVCLPMLLKMPSTPHTNGERTQTGFSINTPSFMLLCGGFALATAEAGVWSLNQKFSIRAGLSISELGPILGVAGLVGLLGAAFAAWFGTRFGRTIPVFISVLLVGVSHFTIVTADSYMTFVVGLMFEGVALMFAIPFLYGFAVELDNLGRLATFLGGAMLLGRSAGPIFASNYLSASSYDSLGNAVLMVDGVALIAFLIAILLRFRQFKEHR